MVKPGQIQNHLTISGSEREGPETPPAPLSTVPFRRDPDYVDRGTLLNQIYEKGTTPSARIALVGLGGVGYVKINSKLITAKLSEGNLNLRSNCPTESGNNHPRHGFSGFTQVVRLGLSRIAGI